MTIHMKCCVTFVLAKMNTVGLAIGTWQGQVRPGITLRRLQRDGYLSTNCIIVSCRNFRVLKKALFLMEMRYFTLFQKILIFQV